MATTKEIWAGAWRLALLAIVLVLAYNIAIGVVGGLADTYGGSPCAGAVDPQTGDCDAPGLFAP